tara:strand:+ start:2249 stop:2554 length:306 start_codon:yes stop_codon:yes gene_type:complete
MSSNIVESEIIKILDSSFNPLHLEVTNESNMHNVPEGSESHFKLLIVSDAFSQLSAVKRHQAVYRALSGVMELIHALSMHLYDLKEYESNPKAVDSPDCVN